MAAASQNRSGDVFTAKIAALTGTPQANVAQMLVAGQFRRQIQTVPGLRDAIADWLRYMEAIYVSGGEGWT
jgi:hypothetical protein